MNSGLTIVRARRLCAKTGFLLVQPDGMKLRTCILCFRVDGGGEQINARALLSARFPEDQLGEAAANGRRFFLGEKKGCGTRGAAAFNVQPMEC